MSFSFVCNKCGKQVDPGSFAWRCDCGGLLDLAEYPVSFPLEKIRQRPATLWRYREALPFNPDYTGWEWVTMGEGMTPLVPVSQDSPKVLLKVDYAMPTLSFKDRGAAVLITKAQELGARRVIADSSGNAGTAIAAYCARAGIACEVFVPGSTSPKKLKQIQAHGATVHAIPGTREDTAAAAIAAVEEGNVFYASHVYNPFFYQGTKTYAFEIWEQLGGKAPDVLVLPVGNGTLVLGAYYGFKELIKAGKVDKMPRILAVQAEGCAPLAKAFWASQEVAEPVTNTGTEAEGIAIAAPARSREILAAVRDTGGIIITVPEGEIEPARSFLASRGFYVEPTAAATYGGFVGYVASLQGLNIYPSHTPLFSGNPLNLDSPETVVIPLCGAGLKAG